MPSVPWRVEFSKIFNFFFFKIPKRPKIVPKSIQTCFELVLGQIFRKFFCPVFRGGSSFRKFSKKNIFKIPKMPKSVLKSIQTCFEHVLGKIFRKKILPSFPWKVESSKIFKKNQKSFKFPKMPKIVPKSIQTCSRVIFLEKILCPVFHGGLSFRKFSKIFFFKIPKMPKIVPEIIQTCFERVLGQIFRIIFLPSVPWRVEFSKIFKIFFFQNSKNAQNRSRKYPNVF